MRIQAFGYTFIMTLFKDQDKKSVGTHPNTHPTINAPLCTVVWRDPYYLLCTPDNKQLPGQISLEIVDGLNQPLKAVVTLFVKGSNEPTTP